MNREAVLVLAGVVVMAACNSEVVPLDGDDAGRAGSAGAAGMGGTTQDAGGAAGSTAGGGGAAGQGDRFAFGVTVGRFVFAGEEATNASAGLVAYQPGDLPYTQEFGNCGFTDSREFDGYPPDTPHAGTITLSGGTGDDWVMEPFGNQIGAMYHQSSSYSEPPRWNPGDLVTVVAEGAQIPAFEEDFMFPAMINLIAPNLSAVTEPVTVRRDTGFPLSWEPTDGRVIAGITQGDYSITCYFDAQDGTAEIPSTILTNLDPSDMSGTYTKSYVNVLLANVEEMIAGPYEIEIAGVHGIAAEVNVE